MNLLAKHLLKFNKHVNDELDDDIEYHLPPEPAIPLQLSYPLKDKKGKVIGYQAIVQDESTEYIYVGFTSVKPFPFREAEPF